MIRAVVFDMDDTLYPEREYLLGGYRAVAEWGAAHFGIPLPDGAMSLKRLIQKGVEERLFNHWLAHYDLDTEERAVELVHVFREHAPALRPFPQVPPLLAALSQKYLLGLVSDGYLKTQQGKLAAVGLASFFSAIVFSDSFGREAWKPSTIPFSAVLYELGVQASEAVYVADNAIKDFYGARQLGICTVGIIRFGALYETAEPPTPEHEPEHIIFSLNELSELLDGLGQ
jgi:putative hydrolase of the HAD superfamily